MSAGAKTVGVLTTDRALIVRSWDAWLVDATGIPADVARGQPLAALFPEVEERGHLARLRRVAEQGVVEVLAPAFHHYLIPCRPRGHSAHFGRMQQHVTISPLRDEGVITGVVITIEDVTARLDRERDLVEQLRSDDEALRLRAAQTLAAEEAPADTLVAAFADPSWRVRQSAVESVARRAGDDVVPVLIRALREQHDDPAVLNATISALVSSGHDVLPPLLELLGSPDADLRIYVALALGQLGDARAVSPLVAALSDEEVNVTYHAIEALGRLRARDAVEALTAVAETRDFFLAFPALEALTAIGDATIAPRLVPLLEDEVLLPAAAEALGRLGDEDMVIPLASLLNRDGVPAAPIATALATLHYRFESAYGEGELVADLARSAIAVEGMQNLVAALRSASDYELACLALVLGWLEFEGVERLLVSLLGHAAVRDEAVKALVRKGSRASRILVAELPRLEGDACRAAVGALGRIGSPEAVPALIGLLEDAPEVAVIAAGALGATGDPRGFEPLLSLLGHADAVVRQAAVGALNSIGHPEMEGRVRVLLRDGSAAVRESAAKIAGYFGFRGCLEPLLDLCGDPDEGVRRAAVEHLGYFDDPRVEPALAAALREGHPGVRAAAARALAHLPTDSASPQLNAALDDPDLWVRYYGARSAALHPTPELRARLQALVSADPVVPVRIAAAWALGEIGEPASLAVLARLAESPETELACAGLAALARIGAEAGHRTLLAALESPDVQRQVAALEGLKQLASPATVRGVLRVAQSSMEPEVVRAAVDALGRIATPEAVEALLDLAIDRRCRSWCIATLSRLGEERLEWIGKGLRHSNEDVREAAVESLARAKHRSASRLLASALGDPSPAVRLAAERALARVDLRSAEAGLRESGGRDDLPGPRRAAGDAVAR